MNKQFYRYKVYDDGRIYSDISKKFLKPALNNKGYYFLYLRIDNKSVYWLVSRLVATCFIPNPHKLPEINHIDGNPQNNNVNNLEWCSRSQNVQDSYNRGFKGAWHNKKGKEHCRSIGVVAIKGNIEYQFGSINEASRELNISHGNISQAISGKRNHAGGYTWKLQ